MVCQIHRFVAQLRCFRSGCPAQLPDAADDLRADVGQFLGRLLPQAGSDFVGKGQRVFFGNGKSLFTGGQVGSGRTGGDHIQGVTQHVGQNDGFHLRRGAPLGEPSALDLRQPLADGVHLGDLRTAGQQLLRHILQFLAGNNRLFKQCAAAAGQEEQHRIGVREILCQVQRRLGSPEAVLIWDGVAGLIADDTGNLTHDMVIFRHHHAAGQGNGQMLHSGCRHLPGRFTGRHQKHPTGEGDVLQRPLHSGIGLHRFNGGTNDALGVGTQFLIHNATPFG